MYFQAIVLLFLITSSLGVLHIERLEHHGNDKLANLSVTYISDGISDLVLNITVETKVVIRKMIGHVKILLAESPEDKEFKKEYLKMTIDHEKLISGVTGGFVLRAFMENFKSAVDTELKFPLKKATYKLVNFKLSDRLVPFPVTTRGSAEVRYMVKVEGKRTFEHALTWKAVGSINKGF